MATGIQIRNVPSASGTRVGISNIPGLAVWLLAITGLVATGRGQGLVLVPGEPRTTQQLHAVADFLGIPVETVDGPETDVARRVAALAARPGALAIALPEKWLGRLPPDRLRGGRAVPVLIFGIAPESDGKALSEWSGGAAKGCDRLPRGDSAAVLEAAAGDLTGVLAGLQFPAVAFPACELRTGPAARAVLTVRGAGGRYPVLVHAGNNLFLLPRMDPFDVSWTGRPYELPKAFGSAAPLLLFLKHAAGEFAWHSAGHYANFTVDDAWLVEPYGNLDYRALLAEMEKHNFHTSIAFVPWNFDRSRPNAAALFRAHPDRFSVAIHGNNHVHREFGDFATNPLSSQAADIRQSIARMERFRALTGIPYDRVMIFPHAVAPEQTFAALAASGFQGTANQQNVPLGAPYPADPFFPLRSYTAAYGRLLSLGRYSAEGSIDRTAVAIQAFLGDPLLFYGHEKLFGGNIGAFNPVADYVHSIQPDTRWTGLGEIARHTYLLRRRLDSGWDVRMFSSEMDLTNPAAGPAEFHIQTEAAAAGCSVAIAGAPPLVGAAAVATVPARQTVRVRLVCPGDTDSAHDPVRKGGASIHLLRYISDFRDLYLSRIGWGRSLAGLYYRYRIDTAELYLERYWPAAGGICALAALLYVRRRKSRRKPSRTRAAGAWRTL